MSAIVKKAWSAEDCGDVGVVGVAGGVEDVGVCMSNIYIYLFGFSGFFIFLSFVQVCTAHVQAKVQLYLIETFDCTARTGFLIVSIEKKLLLRKKGDIGCPGKILAVASGRKSCTSCTRNNFDSLELYAGCT